MTWAIFVAAAGIVAAVCVAILRPFAHVIAWSAVLAILCCPLQEALVRRTRRVALNAFVTSIGMNLQSSTLKYDESGEPLHIQQRKQIEAYRDAWKEAGHRRTPRVSVSRSIFPLVDDRDRACFGRDGRDRDQVGYIDANTRAIFGRSYAAEPEVLVKELGADEAIAAADTLLITVPNTLGVDYNAHVLESVLKYVAPELGWRGGTARSLRSAPRATSDTGPP